MITATSSRAHATSTMVVRQNCLYWLGIFVLVRLCLDIIWKQKFIAHLFDKSSVSPPHPLQLVWRVWTMFARLVKCSRLPSRIRQPSVCPNWSRTFSQLKCKQIIPQWNTTTILCSYQLFPFIYAGVSNQFAFYFVLQSPTLVPMGNPLPIAVS